MYWINKIIDCKNYKKCSFCDKIKEMRIFREVSQWEGCSMSKSNH